MLRQVKNLREVKGLRGRFLQWRRAAIFQLGIIKTCIVQERSANHHFGIFNDDSFASRSSNSFSFRLGIHVAYNVIAYHRYQVPMRDSGPRSRRSFDRMRSNQNWNLEDGLIHDYCVARARAHTHTVKTIRSSEQTKEPTNECNETKRNERSNGRATLAVDHRAAISGDWFDGMRYSSSDTKVANIRAWDCDRISIGPPPPEPIAIEWYKREIYQSKGLFELVKLRYLEIQSSGGTNGPIKLVVYRVVRWVFVFNTRTIPAIKSVWLGYIAFEKFKWIA